VRRRGRTAQLARVVVAWPIQSALPPYKRVAVRVCNPNRLLPQPRSRPSRRRRQFPARTDRLPACVERPDHRKPLRRAQAAASTGPPPRARDDPATAVHASQEPSAAAVHPPPTSDSLPPARRPAHIEIRSRPRSSSTPATPPPPPFAGSSRRRGVPHPEGEVPPPPFVLEPTFPFSHGRPPFTRGLIDARADGPWVGLTGGVDVGDGGGTCRAGSMMSPASWRRRGIIAHREGREEPWCAGSTG
jgi:hypothetical protein